MSNIPSIGKTAIANMAYTNDVFTGVDDIIDEYPPHFFDIGWTFPMNFEAVDGGSNEPQLLSAFPTTSYYEKQQQCLKTTCQPTILVL